MTMSAGYLIPLSPNPEKPGCRKIIVNYDYQQNTRHCAFCFKDIPASQVQENLCPTCGRRAYCSSECRLKDFTPKKDANNSPSDQGRGQDELEGEGQGHADWCHLSLPEEDLDWIVEYIEVGHHMSLRALRLIPTMTRIAVEGLDKGVSETCWTGATNGRIRLADHSCRPNASVENDAELGVAILYSTRDIKPGEEITVSYALYNESYTQVDDPFFPNKYLESNADCRQALTRMKISCRDDCTCKSKEFDDLIKFGRKIYGMLELVWRAPEEMLKSRQDADQGLELVGKLLENHAQIQSPWMSKIPILQIGLTLACNQKATGEIVRKFTTAIWRIQSSILHPESGIVKEADFFVKNVGSITEGEVIFSLDKKYPEEIAGSCKKWGEKEVENLCKYVSYEVNMGESSDKKKIPKK